MNLKRQRKMNQIEITVISWTAKKKLTFLDLEIYLYSYTSNDKHKMNQVSLSISIEWLYVKEKSTHTKNQHQTGSFSFNCPSSFLLCLHQPTPSSTQCTSLIYEFLFWTTLTYPYLHRSLNTAKTLGDSLLQTSYSLCVMSKFNDLIKAIDRPSPQRGTELQKLH